MFKEEYNKQFHYFAFPRVGSHFFFHCLTGLYDLILFDSECYHTLEYQKRSDELNPNALYALRLHDLSLGKPQPIYVNPCPNGIHGVPIYTGLPIISLIRDPFATVYSFVNLNISHLKNESIDYEKFIIQNLDKYIQFYTNLLEISKEHPSNILLITYENLVSSSETLNTLTEFINQSPKLRTGFVFDQVKFDNLVNPDKKSF
ncbi:MAG: hypothetical protein O2827_05015, partial [Verrucomicrobia bacterium]|nr:hypothetical protein [Verrucomicrobiota bacterium]